MEKELKYQFIIDHMSLEEKASLMSGRDCWHTKPVARLGIPAVMMTDGPHGLRKQAGQGDHLGLGKSVPSTCYPTAATLANSWDEDMLEELGRHIGKEAASEKVSMVLGPGVNIKRSPLCGRNFEYYSEDPFLSGKLASALIRGIQSQGVHACVKHFAVNSQELRRMTVDSVVDERTLREIYLPAFEMAVKEAGVKGLMTCYNRVNGTYGSEHQQLLRDILYNEWGFEGLVVSDWGANNDRVEGIRAGLTLEMPSCSGVTDRQIVQAVNEGRLDEKLLDEQVNRLLGLVFDTGKIYSENSDYDRAAHHLFAQHAAEEGAILLKNEGGLLPLSDRGKTVAVIGPFADKPRYQGAGSSKINPSSMDYPLDCLRRCGINIKGYAPGFERRGAESEKLRAEALKLAASADAVLLYLGLDESGEAEGVDRVDMLLPSNQLKLLEALSKVNKNIAVVLSCGCAVEMQWHRFAKAVIHGYLGGQAGAMAMARLVSGKVSPSGKLAETVPLNLASTPCSSFFPGTEATAEYREGIYVGYRYYESANVPPMYPFGFGLSYTKFEYSDIRVEGDRVYFSIENTGAVPGAEIAQLYVSAHTGGMFRPKKELKGFKRVFLRPGEKKEVSIPFDERSFAVWSVLEHDWVIEPGEYELMIGASSTDIRLAASLVKDGPQVEDPYASELFAPWWEVQLHHVADESFAALIGRKLPPAKWDREAPFGVNDTISQGEYKTTGLGRGLYRAVKLGQDVLSAVGKKDVANDLSFIMNMPYRAVGRMSGLFDDEQMAAIVKLVNGDSRGKADFVSATLAKRKKRS